METDCAAMLPAEAQEPTDPQEVWGSGFRDQEPRTPNAKHDLHKYNTIWHSIL